MLRVPSPRDKCSMLLALEISAMVSRRTLTLPVPDSLLSQPQNSATGRGAVAGLASPWGGQASSGHQMSRSRACHSAFIRCGGKFHCREWYESGLSAPSLPSHRRLMRGSGWKEGNVVKEDLHSTWALAAVHWFMQGGATSPYFSGVQV